MSSSNKVAGTLRDKHVPFAEWLGSMEKKYGETPDTEFYDVWVYRDPERKIVRDEKAFYAPADGVVLYAKQLKSLDEKIEVKGLKYKAHEVLGGGRLFKGPCLAIGIFLTDYDVHTLRMPTDGSLYYKELPPIDSHNKPLIFAERDLLSGRLQRAYREIGSYIYQNARMVNRIVRDDGYTYYVVEIADTYDKVIAPFSTEQGKFYEQGERFSLIRSGSQADLILPGDFSLSESEIPDLVLHHIEAGLSEVISKAK